MNTKISINLESESIEYLDSVTNNRSAYINQLIKADLKRLRDRQLEQAYIDQENDPEFHQEKQLWECVSGDGLTEDA